MDPFIGEIRIMGFNYAPRGWAFCNGQILSIAQNTALYSLLGNYFGGDGRSTFGLPNLQGAAPMGTGNGAGLSQRIMGQTGGATTVTLQQSQMPMHVHSLMSASGRFPADSNMPGGNAFDNASGTPYAPSGNTTQMSASAIQPTGGGGAHNNMMPYLTLNFCIAVSGIYPQRP